MKSPQRWILVGTLLVLGAFAIHGCGGDDKKNPVTPPTGADVTITITGISGANSYSPSPANVTVDQTVAWRNNDTMAHTATQTGGGGFNTGSIAAGATSTPITITTAGNLDYDCGLHPGQMSGILQVTP